MATKNQCDGCLAGRPIDHNWNHRMGDGQYADLLGCQAHNYVDVSKLGQLVYDALDSLCANDYEYEAMLDPAEATATDIMDEDAGVEEWLREYCHNDHPSALPLVVRLVKDWRSEFYSDG